MIAIIGILIYFWLILTVSKILYKRKDQRKHLLLPLVILNALFWFLAAWNWHQGYVADNNGTSGDSWGMPAFALVLIATFGYDLYIIKKYRDPVK